MNARYFLSCSIALLAASAPSQSTDRLEDLFPATSYAWMQFAGLRAGSEAAGQLGVTQLAHRLLEEAGSDARARYLGGWMRRGLPRLQRHFAAAGIAPESLRAVLQNRMAIGVGRMTFFGGAPVPSVTLAVDVTGCEAAAEEILSALRSAIAHEVPDAYETRRQLDGVEVTALESERHSGAVLCARLGKYLLLSNSGGYLEECLAAARGAQPSMAKHEGYAAARRGAAEAPLLSGFLNTRVIGDALRPFLPYEVGDVCAALGAEDLHGVFFGIGTQGRGSLDVLQLGITGGPDGLLRSALGKSVSLESAKLCPPHTLLFATAAVDSARVRAALARVFDALPKEAQRELQRELRRELERELKRSANMSLADLCQTLQLFGPEVTLAVTTPATSGLFPEMLVMLDVTDPAQVGRLVEMALGRLGEKAVSSIDHEGTKILYTNALRRGGVPYSPALALSGNRLLVASSVTLLKHTLARAAGEEEGLDVRGELARQGIGTEGTSLLAALRVAAEVPQLWRLARPMLQAAIAQQGGVDPELVPDEEEIAEYLADGLVTVQTDENGVTVRGSSALGPGALLSSVCLLLDDTLEALERHDGERSPGKPAPRVY